MHNLSVSISFAFSHKTLTQSKKEGMAEEEVAHKLPTFESKADTEAGLSVQSLETLDVNTLNPLSPEVISRQATINIGELIFHPSSLVAFPQRNEMCCFFRGSFLVHSLSLSLFPVLWGGGRRGIFLRHVPTHTTHARSSPFHRYHRSRGTW